MDSVNPRFNRLINEIVFIFTTSGYNVEVDDVLVKDNIVKIIDPISNSYVLVKIQIDVDNDNSHFRLDPTTYIVNANINFTILFDSENKDIELCKYVEDKLKIVIYSI